jgi:hypothetical protein
LQVQTRGNQQARAAKNFTPLSPSSDELLSRFEDSEVRRLDPKLPSYTIFIEIHSDSAFDIFGRHLDLESADWLERCSCQRGAPSESSGDGKSKIGADIYSLK